MDGASAASTSTDRGAGAPSESGCRAELTSRTIRAPETAADNIRSGSWTVNRPRRPTHSEKREDMAATAGETGVAVRARRGRAFGRCFRCRLAPDVDLSVGSALSQPRFRPLPSADPTRWPTESPGVLRRSTSQSSCVLTVQLCSATSVVRDGSEADGPNLARCLR
jgi:hypothetical protein